MCINVDIFTWKIRCHLRRFWIKVNYHTGHICLMQFTSCIMLGKLLFKMDDNIPLHHRNAPFSYLKTIWCMKWSRTTIKHGRLLIPFVNAGSLNIPFQNRNILLSIIIFSVIWPFFPGFFLNKPFQLLILYYFHSCRRFYKQHAHNCKENCLWMMCTECRICRRTTSYTSSSAVSNSSMEPLAFLDNFTKCWDVPNLIAI